MSPVSTPKLPLKQTYRKEFSLTSGSKYLGIGKGTLRSMIERGEVKATKNAKGHYVIEDVQIFQAENNLNADELNAMPAPVSTRAKKGAGTGRGTQSGTGAVGGAAAPADTGASTSVDESNPLVQNLLLKQQNDTLKQRARELEQERDDWKTQAQKLQEQAGITTRLLTDQSTSSKQENAISRPQSVSLSSPYVLVLLLVVMVLSFGFVYRDELLKSVVKAPLPGDVSLAPNHS